jgi:hypothetical protein
MLFVSGPRIYRLDPSQTSTFLASPEGPGPLTSPYGSLGVPRGGFSPTLFSGTLASGTLVALTGVLDDRLLVSFGDDGLRRLPIVALAAPIDAVNHGFG